MRGKTVPLKGIVDEALRRTGIVEHVIVVRRTGEPVNMESGRDYSYDELMGHPGARATSEQPSTESMDAEDPLFLLYTSGTTGKPKAIVHTHGGYQVGVSTTLRYVFDIKGEDRDWCAADPGWITGHSYIVYGPLILGVTQVIYEGPYLPLSRSGGAYRGVGVTILYARPRDTRPDALGNVGESHDLSSLCCWIV